jgi:hypothetical protein
MKRIIGLLLLAVMLSSCADKRQMQLELTLLNDTLRCIRDFDINKLYKTSKDFDRVYFVRSVNVVKYKIYNPTDKKYLIVLDPDHFDNHKIERIYNGELIYANLLNLDIFKNGQQLYAGFSDDFLIDTPAEVHKEVDYFLHLDTLNHEKFKVLYRTKGYQLDYFTKVINHSVVIYPGQTKYFRTMINLPTPNLRFGFLAHGYYLQGDGNYQTRLTVFNNKEVTNDHLTPDLKREIKRNGYTIFDGAIHSKKIPLKMIDMDAIDSIHTN